MKDVLTIQDFALYLGAPCRINGQEIDDRIQGVDRIIGKIDLGAFWVLPENVKPVLRPLSSLTEAEAMAGYLELTGEKWDGRSSCLKYWTGLTDPNGLQFDLLDDGIGDPQCWRWLLAHHFDLFGWIDAKLAIPAVAPAPKSASNAEAG